MKPCKECNITKELTEFYTHPLTKDGRIGRCKECVIKGRKTESERAMARARDIKRAKTDKRISQARKHVLKFRKDNPEKYRAQGRVNNFFKTRRELKPNNCVVCNVECKVHMHHYDYSKPLSVIPCCPMCHSWFHIGKIKVTEEYILHLK